MSNLLRSINVRVVGVSFKNNDGTSRQQILSELSVGEAMCLEFFEYENEPAYAVTDVLGNQIGNLPKDLSADIYRKYRDCYFSVLIDDITGGVDGLKYGCIISIDIYDTAPDFDKSDISTIAPDTRLDNTASSDISIFKLIGTFFQFVFSLAQLAFWIVIVVAIIAFIIWII